MCVNDRLSLRLADVWCTSPQSRCGEGPRQDARLGRARRARSPGGHGHRVHVPGLRPHGQRLTLVVPVTFPQTSLGATIWSRCWARGGHAEGPPATTGGRRLRLRGRAGSSAVKGRDGRPHRDAGGGRAPDPVGPARVGRPRAQHRPRPAMLPLDVERLHEAAAHPRTRASTSMASDGG